MSFLSSANSSALLAKTFRSAIWTIPSFFSARATINGALPKPQGQRTAHQTVPKADKVMSSSPLKRFTRVEITKYLKQPPIAELGFPQEKPTVRQLTQLFETKGGVSQAPGIPPAPAQPKTSPATANRAEEEEIDDVFGEGIGNPKINGLEVTAEEFAIEQKIAELAIEKGVKNALDSVVKSLDNYSEIKPTVAVAGAAALAQMKRTAQKPLAAPAPQTPAPAPANRAAANGVAAPANRAAANRAVAKTAQKPLPAPAFRPTAAPPTQIQVSTPIQTPPATAFRPTAAPPTQIQFATPATHIRINGYPAIIINDFGRETFYTKELGTPYPRYKLEENLDKKEKKVLKDNEVQIEQIAAPATAFRPTAAPPTQIQVSTPIQTPAATIAFRQAELHGFARPATPIRINGFPAAVYNEKGQITFYTEELGTPYPRYKLKNHLNEEEKKVLKDNEVQIEQIAAPAATAAAATAFNQPELSGKMKIKSNLIILHTIKEDPKEESTSNDDPSPRIIPAKLFESSSSNSSVTSENSDDIESADELYFCELTATQLVEEVLEAAAKNVPDESIFEKYAK